MTLYICIKKVRHIIMINKYSKLTADYNKKIYIYFIVQYCECL